MVSARQLGKSLRKTHESYLVAFGGDRVWSRGGSDGQSGFWSSSRRVHSKLPKVLPPWKVVDHKMELVPGAKHPSQAFYPMAPRKLVVLRGQLSELLDASYMQPLKAP